MDRTNLLAIAIFHVNPYAPRELELATAEERLEHLREAEFLPEPAEDQRRPESQGVPGLNVVLPGRVENGRVIGELGTGVEQAVELPRLLESIESPEGGQYLLPDVALDAHVVNDLQVFVPTGIGNFCLLFYLSSVLFIFS